MECDSELNNWFERDDDDEFIEKISIDEASEYHHPEPSPFLLERLSRFNEIQKFTHYQNVWLTKEVVIKRYTDKRTFDRATSIQKRLFSSDPLLTCELLETWKSTDEWFTVSRNGGTSLEEISWSDDLEGKMEDVRMRLKNLELILLDDHPGNFVLDDEGICRVIDYESIDEVPEWGHIQ